MDVKDKKPAIIKGLAWGTFSGMATAAAFLLPGFIVGHFLYGQNFGDRLPPWALQGTIIFIIIAALYHSIYRVIASNHDLKLIATLGNYLLLLLLFTLLFPILPLPG